MEAERLDEILLELDRVSSALMAAQGKTGQNVRDNEWLMSIRGRTIIPGGACEFDLPSYYAWQQHPAQQRFDDISQWFSPLLPLFEALSLVLRLLQGIGQHQQNHRAVRQLPANAAGQNLSDAAHENR